MKNLLQEKQKFKYVMDNPLDKKDPNYENWMSKD